MYADINTAYLYQEIIAGPQKRRQYGLSENGGGKWRGVMTAAGTGPEAYQSNNNCRITLQHKLFLHVIFVISSSIVLFEMVDAKTFTVLRVPVKNSEQLEYLNSQYLNTSQFDFWKEPTIVGEDTHVMIKNGDASGQIFRDELQRRNFTYEVMIDDVERLIKQRSVESKRRFSSRKPLYRDATGMRDRIAFALTRYHSFAEIINYLNSLAINFPERVRVQPIGTTHEGRQIPLIRIGTTSNVAKPAIWIDGGIHAREWLVLDYDTDPLMRSFVDQIDWFIVPLLNPDGYEYSRSSADPEIRLWRKNRSPLQCTQINAGLFQPPQTQCCQGVDLNRNFDWFFGQVGSSTDPCSEIYSGTSAFSEPETRSVRDFVSQQAGRIKAFLTFHSYSQILMYPFGHALRTYSQDVDELSTTALKAAQALQSMYGTKYTVGTGADTLYPASGGSEDWAKGRVGVKFSYLFELRPEDNVYDGFLLPENQIMPTGRETWEAVKVIAAETLRQFQVASGSTLPASNAINGVSTAVQKRVCRDLEQLCSYWAQNGACNTWPSMRERCPLSCGFCTAVAG
ncbi:zinc carboxypeptidase domain-containing protein [Ditylenchus destructor]|nr:zinc carboxypeptidase domain-containing protein [Ditylenchus destructor]